MTDFFQDKFKSFGIPNVNADTLKLKDLKYHSEMKDFIFKGSNVIVLGRGHLLLAHKLMKMRFYNNMNLNMLWINHSSMNYDVLETIKRETIDVVALMNMGKPDHQVNIPSAILNTALGKHMQVLIGVNSNQDIEDALPRDLDLLEQVFNVVKVD